MKKFFQDHNIEFYSLIPLKKCKVIKEYLLTKNGFDENSNVITMLFPYRHQFFSSNLSIYASVRDYHYYVSQFASEIEEYVKNKYPNSLFKVFSDHSPIDEVHATCISGLGFIGDNGLLINEKYSSFVFLGECITNLTPEELGMEYSLKDEVRECLHCGKCAASCPCGCIKKAEGVDEIVPKAQCLSAITQKKGELTEEEIKLILDNNTVWGCDICQNVCPFTKKAQTTPIEFFKSNVITELTTDVLNNLSEEEFKMRPFAWRGKSVIERNVKLYDLRRK